MDQTRHAAVAGYFYPANLRELRTTVSELLDSVTPHTSNPPKAIIAPHAGYIYSGPIAATVYASLRASASRIERVLLLGPAHRVRLRGLAMSSALFFESPLGRVQVDHESYELLNDLGFVRLNDEAHAQEHSLEVHLPFLQTLLHQFKLVPLVVGDATAEHVAAVLSRLWGGDETLVVVSSDLSHYHDYRTAQRIDADTSRAIERLDDSVLTYEHACGRNPVSGLLRVAREKHMTVRTVDLRNSGDTAGSRDRVVGYGAYAFY